MDPQLLEHRSWDFINFRITTQFTELAAQRRRFYRRIHALLRREGAEVNVKRVHPQSEEVRDCDSVGQKCNRTPVVIHSAVVYSIGRAFLSVTMQLSRIRGIPKPI